MILLGAVVNGAAIFAGALLGMLLKRGLPEKIKESLLHGLALCVIYIGIAGSLKGENAVIAVGSIVAGVLLGEWLNFDLKFQRFGDFLQSRFAGKSAASGKNTFAEGFISSSLVFCVGAMAIVGSLQSGMNGNHEILFAKAVIDGVFALVMASTLGGGVFFSALPVFLYEGTLTLLANLIAAMVAPDVLAEMTCAGSLLIIAIGTNMMKITNIRVANFILVPFVPIFLLYILR